MLRQCLDPTGRNPCICLTMFWQCFEYVFLTCCCFGASSPLSQITPKWPNKVTWFHHVALFGQDFPLFVLHVLTMFSLCCLTCQCYSASRLGSLRQQTSIMCWPCWPISHCFCWYFFWQCFDHVRCGLFWTFVQTFKTRWLEAPMYKSQEEVDGFRPHALKQISFWVGGKTQLCEATWVCILSGASLAAWSASVGSVGRIAYLLNRC